MEAKSTTIKEPSLSDNIAYLLLINTLGLSVLAETLLSASLFVTHSNGKGNYFNQYRSSYLFVQGTGIQVILNQYGLHYDADLIKSGFNYYIRHLT